jgi:hypothetical protein
MTESFAEDVAILKASLASIEMEWEGKASVLKLKDADYNWRQMEWWAFFFEHLCFAMLRQEFQIPGERFGNVGFDLKRSVNWDLKSKAIKSDDHHAILNDKEAMELSLERYGEHGAIIALCDVEYNDVNRTFQQWHTELKGGKSKYEVSREARTNVSRYRKTRAVLTEILFLRFTPDSLAQLGTMKQGRNSNGRPRREKYMLDLEEAADYLVDRIVFLPVSE